MRPSQTVDVHLVDRNSEPLKVENIMISIQFFVEGKFRYEFNLGVTNSEGQVKASYHEIEELRKQNAAYFLMDYNTRLEETDPALKVIVHSDDELRKRSANARRFFQAEPAWAKIWPSNGRVKAQEKLAIQCEGNTVVKLPTELLSSPDNILSKQRTA